MENKLFSTISGYQKCHQHMLFMIAKCHEHLTNILDINFHTSESPMCNIKATKIQQEN